MRSALHLAGARYLAELERVMQLPPNTSEDYVRPYVYLVALALLDDITPLKKASQLPNREKWEWFSYLQKVLYETYAPTSTASIQVLAQLSVDLTPADTPAEWTEITIPKAS
jgi:hypothetical protein